MTKDEHRSSRAHPQSTMQRNLLTLAQLPGGFVGQLAEQLDLMPAGA